MVGKGQGNGGEGVVCVGGGRALSESSGVPSAAVARSSSSTK